MPSRAMARDGVFSMNTTLTSWKEIAAYLGKGVRTVQRWEQRFGLPVRRPSLNGHVIFAIPQELDAWIGHHQTAQNLGTALASMSTTDRLRIEQQGLLTAMRKASARLEAIEQELSKDVKGLVVRLETARASKPSRPGRRQGGNGQSKSSAA
jgi:hypothetical protein